MAFAAGSLGMSRRRFNAYVAVGALPWALLNTLLGYLGDQVFKGSFLLPLAASLAAAAVLAVVAESLRRSHLGEQGA